MSADPHTSRATDTRLELAQTLLRLTVRTRLRSARTGRPRDAKTRSGHPEDGAGGQGTPCRHVGNSQSPAVLSF